MSGAKLRIPVSAKVIMAEHIIAKGVVSVDVDELVRTVSLHPNQEKWSVIGPVG